MSVGRFLRVLTPNALTTLTELRTLREELGIEGAGENVRLQRVLERGSSAIEAAIGRPLIRQQWREGLPGYHTGKLLTSARPVCGTPVVSLMSDPESDFESSTLTASGDVYVENRNAGIITRPQGFGSTARIGKGIANYPIASSETSLWRADYWAGYHPPGSLVISSGISFDSTDNSLNHASSGFPTKIQPDDIITVCGATETANSGRFVVRTATTAKLVVEGGTLTTEAAGDNVEVEFGNMPGDLEEACLGLAKSLWFSKARDRSVASERVGDLYVFYDAAPGKGGSKLGMPKSVAEIIEMYRGVMSL